MIKSDSILSMLCIVGFIGFMVIALIVAFIYSRKRGKAAQECAQKLGFTILQSAPEPLTESLRFLFRNSNAYKLTNLSQKIDDRQQVYLFDIQFTNPRPNRHSRGSADTEYRAVSLISAGLNLPPFLLICRTQAPGFAGDLLDNLVAEGAARSGLKEWQLTPPNFSNQYMLFYSEEAQAQTSAVFSEEVLYKIAQIPRLVVRGERNILVFNSYDVRRGITLDENGLSNHIRQAVQFSQLLKK